MKDENKKELPVLTAESAKTMLVSDIANLSLPEIKDEPKALESAIKSLFAEAGKMSNSKFKTCFLIMKIYDYKLFRHMEYANIYDFCSDKFGMAKTSVNECLQIARRYGLYETDENTDKLIPRYKLDDFFSDYNYSQLYNLRTLTDQTIASEYPYTMTIREIREKMSNSRSQLLTTADMTESVDVKAVEVSVEEEKEVMNAPEEKPKEMTIDLDMLMDKPLKLDNKECKGYILRLDKNSNDLIVEFILKQ